MEWIHSLEHKNILLVFIDVDLVIQRGKDLDKAKHNHDSFVRIVAY
jgi:hypothetical protein